MRRLARNSIIFTIGVFFLANTVLMPWAEASFWEDRRQSIPKTQESSASASHARNRASHDNLLAGLPVALTPASPVSVRPLPYIQSLPGSFPNTSIDPILASLIQAVSREGVVRSIKPGRPSAPVVVHIQDIHGHPEAQKHIGEMVLRILEKHPDTVIGLEGSTGDFPLRDYRLSTPAINKDVSSFFLNTGLISGAEYAGWAAPLYPTLFGLEEPGLYLKHAAAVREALPLQKPLLRHVKRSNSKLEQEKAVLFSASLKELDEKFQAYHRETLHIGPYLDYLAHLAPSEIPQYPAVALFLDTWRMEHTLDVAAAERERTQFLNRLVGKLTPEHQQALIERSAALKSGDLSYPAYIRSLRETARSANVPLHLTPEFSRYLDYVLQADAINPEKLMKDIALLEERAWTRLTQTHEQAELVKKSKHRLLTEKLIRLTMTPQDWEAYQNLGTKSPHLAFMDGLSPFERFYAAALDRNHTLSAHLREKLNSTRAETAVLVAGGFHTEGLMELLAREDFTLVTVTPRLSAVDAGFDNEYLSVFTREKTPLEKLFESPKISIPQTPTLNPIGGNPTAAAVRNLAPVISEGVFRVSEDQPSATVDGAGFSVAVANPGNPDKRPPKSVILTGETQRGLAVSIVRTDRKRPPSQTGAMSDNPRGSGFGDEAVANLSLGWVIEHALVNWEPPVIWITQKPTLRSMLERNLELLINNSESNSLPDANALPGPFLINRAFFENLLSLLKGNHDNGRTPQARIQFVATPTGLFESNGLFAAAHAGTGGSYAEKWGTPGPTIYLAVKSQEPSLFDLPVMTAMAGHELAHLYLKDSALTDREIHQVANRVHRMLSASLLGDENAADRAFEAAKNDILAKRGTLSYHGSKAQSLAARLASTDESDRVQAIRIFNSPDTTATDRRWTIQYLIDALQSTLPTSSATAQVLDRFKNVISGLKLLGAAAGTPALLNILPQILTHENPKVQIEGFLLLNAIAEEERSETISYPIRHAIFEALRAKKSAEQLIAVLKAVETYGLRARIGELTDLIKSLVGHQNKEVRDRSQLALSGLMGQMTNAGSALLGVLITMSGLSLTALASIAGRGAEMGHSAVAVGTGEAHGDLGSGILAILGDGLELKIFLLLVCVFLGVSAWMYYKHRDNTYDNVDEHDNPVLDPKEPPDKGNVPVSGVQRQVSLLWLSGTDPHYIDFSNQPHLTEDDLNSFNISILNMLRSGISPFTRMEELKKLLRNTHASFPFRSALQFINLNPSSLPPTILNQASEAFHLNDAEQKALALFLKPPSQITANIEDVPPTKQPRKKIEDFIFNQQRDEGGQLLVVGRTAVGLEIVLLKFPGQEEFTLFLRGDNEVDFTPKSSQKIVGNLEQGQYELTFHQSILNRRSDDTTGEIKWSLNSQPITIQNMGNSGMDTRGGYWLNRPWYQNVAGYVETGVARVVAPVGILLLANGGLETVTIWSTLLAMGAAPLAFWAGHMFRGRAALFHNPDVAHLTRVTAFAVIPLLLLPLSPLLALTLYTMVLVPVTLHHQRVDNPWGNDVTSAVEKKMYIHEHLAMIQEIESNLGPLQEKLLSEGLNFTSTARILNRRFLGQLSVIREDHLGPQRKPIRRELANAAYLAGRADVPWSVARKAVRESLSQAGWSLGLVRQGLMWLDWLRGRRFQLDLEDTVLSQDWFYKHNTNDSLKFQRVNAFHVDVLFQEVKDGTARKFTLEHLLKRVENFSKTRRSFHKNDLLIVRTEESKNSSELREVLKTQLHTAAPKMKSQIDSYLEQSQIVILKNGLINPKDIYAGARVASDAIKLALYTATPEEIDMSESAVKFIVYSLLGSLRVLPISLLLEHARIVSVNA